MRRAKRLDLLFCVSKKIIVAACAVRASLNSAVIVEKRPVFRERRRAFATATWLRMCFSSLRAEFAVPPDGIQASSVRPADTAITAVGR